jgi:hypothetical protein
MKAFVIMFNRLTWPKALCQRLTNLGLEVILIDNGSVYPPLLEWYKNCPYRVHHLPNYYGHRSLWQSGIISNYSDEYYLVTDHDLDISSVPDDMISVLMQGLEYDVVKSGLSLKLDDLPNNPYTKQVTDWETKFWQTEKRGKFFFSDVDTTLAIYKADRVPANDSDKFFRAVRCDKPYEARHLPWYNTPDNLTEEERFYMDNIKRDVYWTGKFKETWR